MSYKQVYLKPKKEESIKRFHPWIFSGAIARINGTPEEGEIVEVYDSNGNFLALGHCQIGSIAVRILTFENEKIDLHFWENRFEKAYKLRESLFITKNPDNNIYRLVHGEGDNMPGLIVDIYGKTAVIQAHSPGMHYAREELVKALKNVLNDSVNSIYYKSDTTLPYKAELNAINEYLSGETENSSNIAMENGLRFYIDWEKGQKTGFFIDQRDNRKLVEKYAQNKSVLNMFCYTGGFSVFALHGGAKLVHSVDSSTKAMDLTDKNIKLNFPDDDRHQSFSEDAFRFLEKMDEKYDLIILDPPAFAKHRNALKNALQGYRKLNALAIEKIEPGGILFTFSCSQAVSKDNFRLAVLSAAVKAKRNVKIIHQLTQAADHPISIYHPEGEYIKGLVLKIE